MRESQKRFVYLSRKPNFWDYHWARMWTGLTIAGWFLLVLGLNGIAMKFLHPLGYIFLLVGLLLALPTTFLAVRAWKKILRARKGVVLDDDGITLYGDFVSWSEIKEVRGDPEEGYILVFRPDDDPTEPLCSLEIDSFPNFWHFLESLQDRGIEIKTHRR